MRIRRHISVHIARSTGRGDIAFSFESSIVILSFETFLRLSVVSVHVRRMRPAWRHIGSPIRVLLLALLLLLDMLLLLLMVLLLLLNLLHMMVLLGLGLLRLLMLLGLLLLSLLMDLMLLLLLLLVLLLLVLLLLLCWINHLRRGNQTRATRATTDNPAKKI